MTKLEKFISYAPSSVKEHVVEFKNGRTADGRDVMRVLIDRILTDEEKRKLKRHKCFFGVDYVATHRYAPEIKRSYFYVI